jgi:hypothetical protein
MNENQGTPLVNLDELQPELALEDMVIPTRAELEAKQAEVKDAQDDKTDDSKAGDDKDVVPADAGKSDSEDGQGSEDTGQADGSEVYQATLEDPGEFQPADYSFEVTVYDNEGKNGKQVTISSVEQFEQLLDEEKNFGSAGALMKAQRLTTKMESGLERDKSNWEIKKKAFNDQNAEVQTQNEALDQMAAELNYLVGKGKLPQVAKKYQNADWSDPEVAKQPGVKEQVEVLNYMNKENVARRKAGLPDIGISGALSELTMDKAEKAAKVANDAAGEVRRAAGARVAGVNPGPVATAPKGVMVGRSFGDLSNLSNML